jgi:ketosteroid isomerase-like protein
MRKVSARLLPFLLVLLSYGQPALASPSPATAELTKLLHEFLHAATVNDRAVFDKFFAEDVIYTRSAGVTITKADIMKSFTQPGGQKPASQTFDADEITVHQYGNFAIVNFRLIAKPNDGSAAQYYRNTGSFVKHDGMWQAVAWQSTKVPPVADTK